VSAKADLKEIKSQYYKLAKKHHPDAAGPTSTPEELEASKELFKKVTEAYAILSDQTLRTKYDRIIFGDSADKPEFENEGEY
jgi:DnaJ-class molecular chaperone